MSLYKAVIKFELILIGSLLSSSVTDTNLFHTLAHGVFSVLLMRLGRMNDLFNEQRRPRWLEGIHYEQFDILLIPVGNFFPGPASSREIRDGVAGGIFD